MAAILFYNLDGGKGSRLRMLAMRLRVRVQNVSPTEFGETLAALTGREPRTNAACDAPFSGEMLVFVDFDNGLLNRFLTEARKARLTVPLKAVLTPTNMHWTSVRLHEEIGREHEALRKGKSAHAPDGKDEGVRNT